MPDSLLALFCHVDDFCQLFLPRWQHHLLAQGILHRQRQRHLCLSEVMTVLIAFHTSPYRDFKAFYLLHMQGQWQAEFPGLVSYSRVCRLHPLGPGPPLCLLAAVLRRLHRNHLCGRYCAVRLS